LGEATDSCTDGYAAMKLTLTGTLRSGFALNENANFQVELDWQSLQPSFHKINETCDTMRGKKVRVTFEEI
jgi:hypothetical protein